MDWFKILWLAHSWVSVFSYDMLFFPLSFLAFSRCTAHGGIVWFCHPCDCLPMIYVGVCVNLNHNKPNLISIQQHGVCFTDHPLGSSRVRQQVVRSRMAQGHPRDAHVPSFPCLSHTTNTVTHICTNLGCELFIWPHCSAYLPSLFSRLLGYEPPQGFTVSTISI